MASCTMEKINEIEKGFRELTLKEPEILSASNFHTNINRLLVDCLDFRRVGERSMIYQYFGDVYEDDSFRKGKPRGFVYKLSNDDFEQTSKDLIRFVSRKPENYSRKAYYTKSEGERITVSSHHDSPNNLIEGRLRSPNLDLSTTIVYKNELGDINLGHIKFERTFLGNLGEATTLKESPVLEAFNHDYVLKYKNRYIVPVSFIIDAARRHN